MAETPPADLRRRIRAARAYAGISSAELARRVAVGRSTIVRIEAGERAPSRDEIAAIADACDLPLDWFWYQWRPVPEHELSMRAAPAPAAWPDYPFRAPTDAELEAIEGITAVMSRAARALGVHRSAELPRA